MDRESLELLNNLIDKHDTLEEWTKIVVETDTKNPVTIATITPENVDMAIGYRVRLTPRYD